MVLDAPPGSGKTVIAEAVRRLLRTRGLYICHTRGLQDQFAEDFDYCSVLKGRSNYPTMRGELYNGPSWSRVTAADCTKSGEGEDRRCIWCDPISGCPYEIAKGTLLRSQLGCINSAYFLYECNYVGRLSGFPFVIIDECDTFESELMGFIGFELTERRVREYELGEPRRVTKSEAWLEWVEGAQGVVRRIYEREKTVDLAGNLPAVRRWNNINRLMSDLGRLKRGLEEGAWVFTGRDGRVAFKPIRVSEHGKECLWKHGGKFLLMSGTVISGYEIMDSLGGGDLPWGLVSVPSFFDEERRRVKVVGVADMRKKELDANRTGIIESVAEAISGIVARHPGQRVLVHTVSYDLANDLSVAMVRTHEDARIFTYGNAAERDRVLAAFTDDDLHGQRDGSQASDPTKSILFGSSMDRGIDLPDDACRVIVIVKVPYPYLGDRQVAARLYSHGGQVWYNVQTVRSIVQMCGRAVRHEDDWAVTYILDRNFVNGIWAKSRGLFPQWWKDGLDWKDRL